MKVNYKILRLSGDLQCQSSRGHIPGKLILYTDRLSRGGQSLDLPEVHHRPLDSMGSSSGGSVRYLLEPQTSNVWVLFPDKVAWAVDALSISWENMFHA